MFYEVFTGYYKHRFASNDRMIKMNRIAFSISRGVREGLSHRLFTVHRFRMLNLITDFIAFKYVLLRMKVHSILDLGRSDDQMYYIIEKNKGVFHYKYTHSSTNIRSPFWNIPTHPVSAEVDEDFRIKHLGPTPKKFKTSFLMPRHKSECDKWILYATGGAFIYHNMMLLPRLQSTFPDFGIAFVEYSLVPEKCWPSPLLDVLDSYKYLLEVLQINPANIFFFSDSAGGNLMLSTLMRLNELNLPKPECTVFVSPWSDLTCSGPSFKDNKHIDYLDDELDIQLLLEGYCNTTFPNDELLKNKDFSPVNGNLSGFPPTLISTGGCEALLDDNTQLYNKLKDQGNEVTHSVYEMMPHIFQMLYFEESQASLDEIKEFVNKYIPF